MKIRKDTMQRLQEEAALSILDYLAQKPEGDNVSAQYFYKKDPIGAYYNKTAYNQLMYRFLIYRVKLDGYTLTKINWLNPYLPEKIKAQATEQLKQSVINDIKSHKICNPNGMYPNAFIIRKQKIITKPDDDCFFLPLLAEYTKKRPTAFQYLEESVMAENNKTQQPIKVECDNDNLQITINLNLEF